MGLRDTEAWVPRAHGAMGWWSGLRHPDALLLQLASWAPHPPTPTLNRGTSLERLWKSKREGKQSHLACPELLTMEEEVQAKPWAEAGDPELPEPGNCTDPGTQRSGQDLLR